MLFMLKPSRQHGAKCEKMALRRVVCFRVAALALAALAVLTVLLEARAASSSSALRRPPQALSGVLVVAEPAAAVAVAESAGADEAQQPPAGVVTSSVGTSTAARAPAVVDISIPFAPAPAASACCSLRTPRPHNVSLSSPVPMKRPITVLMRAGNLDGPFACDVPCQFATHTPADGDVDVVVGEAARPTVPEQVRQANPRVLTAARSMESASYYPALKTLHQQVDAAMLTTLATSQVPVTYLRRSSVAMWGTAPVVWNASALRALAARKGASAVFVARNCASRNGREQEVMALDGKLPGGVDRPSTCLNSVAWPSCASKKGGGGSRKERCGKHAVLRRYPFYLAYENSKDEDYVTEKVFHALEAGVLPVYLGTANVVDFVPPHSVVQRGEFESVAALAEHLASLLAHPSRYLEYFAWKRAPLPSTFQQRLGFVATHAKCRLCRWAYARKFGYRWSRDLQEVVFDEGG